MYNPEKARAQSFLFFLEKQWAEREIQRVIIYAV